MSSKGVMIPCMFPSMVLRPRFSSMKKNSTDQKGAVGNRFMASVKAMNASPVPSTPCRKKRSVSHQNGTQQV